METPKLFSDAPQTSFTNEEEEDEENDELFPTLEGKSPEELNGFYELERVAKWIKENGFRRVALQLPDAFLAYALHISHYLENSTSAKVYVLGDTSYRNCCVDDVAAEHAKCDSLVHFGDACLSSPSSKIPLLYVFCEFKLDVKEFEIAIKSTIEGQPPQQNVAFIYDSFLLHTSDLLVGVLNEMLTPKHNVVVCNAVDLNSEKETNGTDLTHSFGREVPERMSQWENATLIFVGREKSPLLPLWLMTHVQFDDVIHFIPGENRIERFSSYSSRMLKKRLFLIEKLRDANTVGLVVGTLAVHGFKEAISRIRNLCKVAQKKLYVLSIGKLNEAKLSNFATDIDAFILLSCPFGIGLSNEFFKPVVSFFEAEIALNPSKMWYSGKGWTAQFNQLLKDDIGSENQERTDVSLITGRMRVTHLDEDKDSADKNGKEVVQYTAGDYFANRSWKGLRDEHLEDSNTTIKEGLSGIAAGYATEN